MIEKIVHVSKQSNFEWQKAQQLCILVKEARERFKNYRKNQKNKEQILRSYYECKKYGEYEILENILFSQYFLLKKKEVLFGFIAKKDEDFFVVFRGSQTTSDWFSNVRFWQDYKNFRPDIPGKVHKGFQTQYIRKDHQLPKGKQSISQLIHTTLKNAGAFNENKNIYISGHSLGGALATLAAADLSKSYPEAQFYLYTFGSPRVGNSQFKRLFEENNTNIKAFRIFNKKDFITKLPFSRHRILRYYDYQHIGEELFFKNKCLSLFPLDLQDHTLPIYACALKLNPEDFRYNDYPFRFTGFQI